MRSGIKRGIVAAATAVCAAAALTIGTAGNSAAAGPVTQAFGITPDGLTMASFRTDRPQSLDWVQDITGMSGDTKALGIDFRVQNNTLYMLGNLGGIYTVTTLGDPSQVAIATKVSQLTVTLNGTNFDIDFNPAADRLRIVSDSGQNLAHNLNNHTTATNTAPPCSTSTPTSTRAWSSRHPTPACWSRPASWG
jgi:hypothetical protein